MRYVALATSALLSLTIAQSQLLAEATIAVAHPPEDDGWAMGISYSAASQADADEVALDNCLAQRQETGVRADCLIVARFDNQCMAVSKDTGNEGTAWGLGSLGRAGRRRWVAMANCQRFAGSRAGYCEVTIRRCDGE